MFCDVKENSAYKLDQYKLSYNKHPDAQYIYVTNLY
jgi:hypothetical protein